MSATPPDNGYEAFLTLGRFLQKDGWHPEAIEEQLAYRMICRGEQVKMPCYAIIHEDDEQFIFYVDAPLDVPEAHRLEMVKFITRANYGLRIGNFEMGIDKGRVRFKSSLVFKDIILYPDMIHNIVYPAVTTLDAYFPALHKVSEGKLTAEEAIKEVEG